LIRKGQWIPGVSVEDESDLARTAQISASSTLRLSELAPSGEFLALTVSRALLLPLVAGAVPTFTFLLQCAAPSQIVAELWSSKKRGNYVPEVFHERCTAMLDEARTQEVEFHFDAIWPEAEYAFVVLRENPQVQVARTTQRITGILSVSRGMNRAVAKSSVQIPPPDKGLEKMEFWLPSRRPDDQLIAVKIAPPLEAFASSNAVNQYARPYLGSNAWVAMAEDRNPRLKLEWAGTQQIARVVLNFDTDFDHPMESVSMMHPEHTVPFCIRRYRLIDDHGRCIYEIAENHQSRNEIVLGETVVTRSLELEVLETFESPAAVFKVSCFGPND
jgi:hypothetical protein